jgi:hypothetical protein
VLGEVLSLHSRSITYPQILLLPGDAAAVAVEELLLLKWMSLMVAAYRYLSQQNKCFGSCTMRIIQC